MLEIGPGAGALTDLLAGAGADVAAIELDLGWAFALGQRLASDPSRHAGAVRIAAADALELAWDRLPATWRVGGNLPYNIGTAVVERFLMGAPSGVRAGFLLQREVVERMTARPGTRPYGALTVRVAARAELTKLGNVPAGAFVPPPKVESAFVGLVTHPAPLGESGMAGLDHLIASAFGQRRKSLRNAIAARYGRDEAAEALRRCGIDGGRRAETLALDDFLALWRALSPT